MDVESHFDEMMADLEAETPGISAVFAPSVESKPLPHQLGIATLGMPASTLASEMSGIATKRPLATGVQTRMKVEVKDEFAPRGLAVSGEDVKDEKPRDVKRPRRMCSRCGDDHPYTTCPRDFPGIGDNTKIVKNPKYLTHVNSLPRVPPGHALGSTPSSRGPAIRRIETR